MKKVLSVLLALVMIFSCFGAIVAFAEDSTVTTPVCTCKDCTHQDGCHCCVYCEYLDKGYLTSCVTYDENGVASFCCSECTGIWPCDCGCSCCANYAEEDDGTGLPLLTEEQQKTFIEGAQAVLQRIADIFDQIFDAIFEFLRISEIFPDLFN